MTSITDTSATYSPVIGIIRKPWGQRFQRVMIYLALLALTLGFLLPVYLVITTALKTQQELNLLDVWKLPQGLNFSSFADAFTQLLPYFMNSLMLTIPATIISAMLGSLNGYVLSKWQFRAANIIFPLRF